MAAVTTNTPSVNTIELFQSLKQYYYDIGIFPSHRQPNHCFNWKKVFILCVLMLTFVAMLLYFLYEANSIVELAITFYGFSSILTAVINNVISVLKRDQIFQLFKNFDEFIEKRKFKYTFYRIILFGHGRT